MSRCSYDFSNPDERRNCWLFLKGFYSQPDKCLQKYFKWKYLNTSDVVHYFISNVPTVLELHSDFLFWTLVAEIVQLGNNDEESFRDEVWLIILACYNNYYLEHLALNSGITEIYTK